MDSSDDARSQGRPFMKDGAKDPRFYDSPCWNLKENDHLNWEAFLFPVKIRKNRVIPLGGVRWGYSIQESLDRMVSFVPSPLKPEDWNRFGANLRKAYPKWEFQKAGL